MKCKGGFYIMRAAITILDMGYDYTPTIEQLQALGIEARYIPLEGTDDRKTICQVLAGYDFILAGPELYDSEVLQTLSSSLKLIARLGVGVDKINLAAATGFGIAVCNAPGGNACSVAQHALSLMLDLSMNVTKYDRLIRNGRPYRRTMAQDLIGKTVGLLGFGRISAELTKLLSGFACRVLAYDVYPNQELAASLGVEFVSIDELCASSDYISLHLPLTESTHGLVDWQFFEKMKQSAFFVNTARGPIVNEPDLIRALKSGLIAGAGLDVFDGPLEGNELLSLDNVVATPYVAFSSKLGTQRTFDMAVRCICSYISGQRPDHLLNPDYIRHIQV